MPSFQITITPSRRAAARFINEVRRKLQKTLIDEKAEKGVTQSDLAREIGVHRSVINRELRGFKDITMGRVGELAWAMGYVPVFELEKALPPSGSNIADELAAGENSAP